MRISCPSLRAAGLVIVASLVGVGMFISPALGQAATPPIQVIIDVHVDPITACSAEPCTVYLDEQSERYIELVDALNWVLDEADPRGAKISFLMGGEFAEWTLVSAGEIDVDPPLAANPGPPLLLRLRNSGAQIGTHSHTKIRLAEHDWVNTSLNPEESVYRQHWDDHVGLVNDAILAVFPSLSDPMELNTTRGGGIPTPIDVRLDMMVDDYGFQSLQQGEDQEFYDYFQHYVMNPWRPSHSGVLQEDLGGEIVMAPMGSILGVDGEHFGIYQYNSIEYKQARLLMEVLNWLDAIHVSGEEKVWTFGWGSHPHDYEGGPTRAQFPTMLDWLNTHFVGKTIGGRVAAVWSTQNETRAALEAWETANPGESSFDYSASTSDWSLYPYLKPAAHYLVEAQYVSAMTNVSTVRWHQVTSNAGATVYVAYTVDGVPTTVDLAPQLGPGQIAAVNPANGSPEIRFTNSVRVPPEGILLMDPGNVLAMCDGLSDPDFPALGGPCPTTEPACSTGVMVCSDDMLGIECSISDVEVCDGVDNDCDGLFDEGVAAPVDHLELTLSGGSISWSPVTDATGYDIVRGDLAILTATGNLTAAITGCLANDTPATTLATGATPAPGTAVFYLGRPTNCGGGGSYGSPARDSSINASSSACP